MQRQIKSCTHCRQHKVRCDASKCYPKPCTRCSKFHLGCVIDQNFKPRKGGQVELLREHLAKIQEQIHSISKIGKLNHEVDSKDTQADNEPAIHLPQLDDEKKEKPEASLTESSHKRALDANHDISSLKRIKLAAEDNSKIKADEEVDTSVKEIEASVAERMAAGGRLVPIPGPYKLEDLVLDEEKADELHDYFMESCAPYMPIFESGSAGELYARSEFLFWAVMVTAALAEPSSDLYLSLVEPVKRLAAKKSLLATTRSSSVVQALLVLSTWPLPSEKILEDMSPRYASLAYSMGLQLGIHRGKFIYEFSRNQQLMPNAVKWRSRTWVQTYITQQMISAASGIPPSMPVDFIIDHALHDEEHPLSSRTAAFLKIAIFYSKLVSIMGTRISTQDGLMDPESRCPTLDLLRTDLYTMFPPSEEYDDPVIEIMFLYARCIMDSFAFLPETPLRDQSGFIIDAFLASTRIVELVRELVGKRKVMEFPSFIRNPCNYAALLLFRLQSMPQIPDQYVASARDSVVAIHHMYRNIPPSWKDSRVSNDISRIAKILESLNHVMVIHPELLRSRRVMRRMRSHLTFSLFYELIYIIHEARRRNAQKKNKNSTDSAEDGAILKKSDAALPSMVKAAAGSADNSSPDSWAGDTPVNTGAMHQLINTDHKNRTQMPLPFFTGTESRVTPERHMEAVDTKKNWGPEATSHTVSRLTNSDSGNENPQPVNNELVKSSRQLIYTENEFHAPFSNHVETRNILKPERHKPDGYPQSYDTHAESLRTTATGATATTTMEADICGGESGDMLQVLNDLDWMNTEGDDFLGWMLPRNE